MVSVLVNGPASWNMLVDLDALPAARPHMVIANAHRWGLGGTSAGKALCLARLGVQTTLRTVLGSDPDAARILAALAHPELTLMPVRTPPQPDVRRRRPGVHLPGPHRPDRRPT
jgi:sugar/nucleoside kinase (ribokinase family)